MKRSLTITCAMIMLAFVPAQATTLFYDDFEDPALAFDDDGSLLDAIGGVAGQGGLDSTFNQMYGWGVFDGLNGWRSKAIDENGGIELQRWSYRTGGYDGVQWVELDTWGNSWMEREVTGFKDGKDYVLEFAYAGNPYRGEDSNGIQFNFGDGISGVVRSGGNGQFPEWTLISRTFTYHTGDPTLLRFEAAGTSDGSGGLIDAVSIREVAPPPAPVPEPASMTLFGLGLAGLGFRRFRKRG